MTLIYNFLKYIFSILFLVLFANGLVYSMFKEEMKPLKAHKKINPTQLMNHQHQTWERLGYPQRISQLRLHSHRALLEQAIKDLDGTVPSYYHLPCSHLNRIKDLISTYVKNCKLIDEIDKKIEANLKQSSKPIEQKSKSELEQLRTDLTIYNVLKEKDQDKIKQVNKNIVTLKKDILRILQKNKEQIDKEVREVSAYNTTVNSYEIRRNIELKYTSEIVQELHKQEQVKDRYITNINKKKNTLKEFIPLARTAIVARMIEDNQLGYGFCLAWFAHRGNIWMVHFLLKNCLIQGQVQKDLVIEYKLPILYCLIKCAYFGEYKMVCFILDIIATAYGPAEYAQVHGINQFKLSALCAALKGDFSRYSFNRSGSIETAKLILDKLIIDCDIVEKCINFAVKCENKDAVVFMIEQSKKYDLKPNLSRALSKTQKNGAIYNYLLANGAKEQLGFSFCSKKRKRKIENKYEEIERKKRKL